MVGMMIFSATLSQCNVSTVALEVLIDTGDVIGVALMIATRMCRGEEDSLADLLESGTRHGGARATLPQDLAYSLMGVATDGKTCGIEVDYSKRLRWCF